MPRISRKNKQYYQDLAHTLFVLTLILLLAVPFTFIIDPTDQLPNKPDFWALLWAWSHETSFYPLLGLILLAPTTAWLSLAIPGKHRKRLLVLLIVSIPVILFFYGPRILIMLKIILRLSV